LPEPALCRENSQPLSGVTMRVTRTTVGDSAAGSDHRAVWNRFSSYIDTTNGVPYDAVTQRSAFDRRSGEAVNCCGAAISSTAGTYTGPQSGQAFTWPIGAGQQPYQVFDTVLRRPVTDRLELQANVYNLLNRFYIDQPHPSHLIPGAGLSALIGVNFKF